MDKAQLFAELRATLQARLDDLDRGQAMLSDGMRVDGDHRPTNRGERGAVTSAGYLAQGLQARRTELTEALELLDRTPPSARDRAVTGAVVTVEGEDGDGRWLLFPGASGVVVGGVPVVSPESPIGRALWGLEEGDEAELPRIGEAEIVDIA